MKVKHATTHDLVNNLSAKRRHPYMHETIVCRYEVTLTYIKLLSVDTTYTLGTRGFLAARLRTSRAEADQRAAKPRETPHISRSKIEEI